MDSSSGREELELTFERSLKSPPHGVDLAMSVTLPLALAVTEDEVCLRVRASWRDNSRPKSVAKREQAARARAKAKALENKKESQANFVIEKRNYSVDREGVKLKKKTLSFGQFQELYEDVEKVRKELRWKISLFLGG